MFLDSDEVKSRLGEHPGKIISALVLRPLQADAAGISLPAWSESDLRRYEAGEMTPTYTQMHELTKHFSISKLEYATLALKHQEKINEKTKGK